MLHRQIITRDRSDRTFSLLRSPSTSVNREIKARESNDPRQEVRRSRSPDIVVNQETSAGRAIPSRSGEVSSKFRGLSLHETRGENERRRRSVCLSRESARGGESSGVNSLPFARARGRVGAPAVV